MVIRTTGSRMRPHLPRGLAMTGRVATNRPAAHQTPTRTRKTTQYTIVPLVPTLVKTGT